MINEDRFYRVVVDALAQDKLVLPTLPEVALRIQDMLRDDDVTIGNVAAEIQRDAALAVRLIRISNSAAVRGGRSVESVQQAVTRLGLDYTRLLVNGLVMEQMFRAGTSSLKDRLTRCWRESVDVAALSRSIAAQCTLLQPEMAMLAGLIHRIGTLPILRLAEKQDSETIDAHLDDVIEALAPRVGRMVLRAWNFPLELVDLPMQWPDFKRDHEGAPDYADVVIAAVVRLRAERSGEEPPADLPAFAKLDLDPAFDLSAEGPLAETYRESLELLRA